MKKITCIFLALTLILAACTGFSATKGEENALRKAQNYLEFMNFS